MKVLVYVDSIDSVPSQRRLGIFIVNGGNWEELIHFYMAKSSEITLFFAETTPVERLLKFIEDYRGDMVVYTAVSLDPVLHSRFTHILNRRTLRIDKSFGSPSSLEESLSNLKKALR